MRSLLKCILYLTALAFTISMTAFLTLFFKGGYQAERSLDQKAADSIASWQASLWVIPLFALCHAALVWRSSRGLDGLSNTQEDDDAEELIGGLKRIGMASLVALPVSIVRAIM